MNVGIIGVTGYGGIELLRWLKNHPHCKITYLGSHSQAGLDITEVYPHLVGGLSHVADTQLQAIDADIIAKKAELIFLSLPSGVSSQIVPQLLQKGLKVIDLAGDFRLTDGAIHEQWYKKPAPPRGDQSQAVYGLTEFKRAEIAQASFITNPGCYPTSVALGIAPLLLEGLIEHKGIVIDAKSGTSGAGRTPNVGNLFTEIDQSLHAYKIGEHQHTPEIEQFLSQLSGEAICLTFTPHLIPMTRGILSTIYGQLSDKAQAIGMTTEKLHDVYQKYYQDEQFVRVQPPGQFPKTKWVCSTNFCNIGIHVEQRTGRVIIVSVIDNMVKGAAGQAIQNMNVMCGWDEGLGLDTLALIS